MGKLNDKHHYIPAFYLKQWAGTDGRLCEMSGPYDVVKPKQVHPDGTGYARGLYTLQGLPPEAANVVETRFLKDADNLGAVALRAFVENRDLESGITDCMVTIHNLTAAAESRSRRRNENSAAAERAEAIR
jgi:hypothetical protein